MENKKTSVGNVEMTVGICCTMDHTISSNAPKWEIERVTQHFKYKPRSSGKLPHFKDIFIN